MKIFLVDDNKQFRDAMKVYLEQALKHKVVGEAGNGIEFLQRYEFKNDIILMDLNMPELDGYQALKKAFIRDTRIRAIAVTMFKDSAYLKKLIEMGFKGCVYKSEVFKKLPIALDEIVKGNLYFPEEINID